MPNPMKDLKDRRRYSTAIRLDFEKRAEDLANRLIAGDLSLKEWQSEMKALIREAHKTQLVTGKGGEKKNVRQADYGKLGANLKEQYKFLQDFATHIYQSDVDGKSLDFVKSRSKLYMKSSQATFWQAAIPVKVPQVPRDGGTRCKSNCKCQLDFEMVTEDGVDVAIKVWWKLRPAEHCTDCKAMASKWNPLRIEIKESFGTLRQGIKLAVHFDETMIDILDLWRATA